MARTATITDERILSAARAEFLEHGIRATSLGIARRAGISSGIVFHRFGSKEALFEAAMNMDRERPVDAGLEIDMMARVGKGRVRDALVDLGDALLETFLLVVPHRVMAWANPTREGASVETARYASLSTEGQASFVAYLVAEARLGRLRVREPALVAKTFGGALWHFAFEQLTSSKRRSPRAASRANRAFVRGLVDLLFSGLRPRGAAAMRLVRKDGDAK